MRKFLKHSKGMSIAILVSIVFMVAPICSLAQTLTEDGLIETAIPSPPVASEMPMQAPIIDLQTIIATLSRNGPEDRCQYLDSSSCNGCQNPVTFVFCVKDAQETLVIFAEGAARVIPVTAAGPMLDAAMRRLADFSFNAASAMAKATELKKSSAACLTALGLPTNSVESIAKALMTIETNGRLPVPQLQGPGIFPRVESQADLFLRHLKEIEARVSEWLATTQDLSPIPVSSDNTGPQPEANAEQ